MTIIRWEDPPAEHGNARPKPPSRFQPIVDALKDRPGQWAVVVENKTPGAAANLAWRMRSGLGPFAPKGAFEAKTIGPAGGTVSKVYARYVGEVSA